MLKPRCTFYSPFLRASLKIPLTEKKTHVQHRRTKLKTKKEAHHLRVPSIDKSDVCYFCCSKCVVISVRNHFDLLLVQLSHLYFSAYVKRWLNTSIASSVMTDRQTRSGSGPSPSAGTASGTHTSSKECPETLSF